MTELKSPGGEDQHPGLRLTPVESHRGWADEWICVLKSEADGARLSQLTLEGYRSKIGYWVAYIEQVQRTNRPTPATVAEYVEFLLQGDREPASVNFYLNTVKSFYRWCESKGYYPAIARSIKAIREHHDGPMPALSHEDMVKLVADIPEDNLHSLRDRALISLMYATAFRTVSIQRADREDVDLSRNAIRHQPKGHKTKDVWAVFAPSVAALLGRYMDRSAAEVRIRKDATGGGLPLFVALDRSSNGKRLTSRYIRSIVLHYMELAGHARRQDGILVNPGLFSAHSIRRSAAVTTADAAGIELAQGLLGHKSADTTRKAYARVKLHRDLEENAHRLDPLS